MQNKNEISMFIREPKTEMINEFPLIPFHKRTIMIKLVYILMENPENNIPNNPLSPLIFIIHELM